jgi:hypothetical protein
MNLFQQDSSARLRRMMYAILICLGIGSMLGRILAVDQVDDSAKEDYRIRKEVDVWRQKFRKQGLEEVELNRRLLAEEGRIRQAIQLRRPFLSANDRSRWCTIRALVEPDMQVTGYPYAIDKVIAQPRWDTIDMIKRGDHFYSSKPPLFPTLLAGEYWLIHRLTGLSLADDTFPIVRFMLVTTNVIPLAIYFILLAALAERFGRTDFSRLFIMGAGVFGTFLTTFAVVVNNHVTAAVSVMIALYAWVRIWFDDDRHARHFILAGLFGAFTVVNELPALAILAILTVALMWKAPRPTLFYYVPAVLVVAAGFFATNWIAVESLRPAYMHRSKTDPDDNWYDYQYMHNGRLIDSYWRNPQGIDCGEPSPRVYALNVLIGHHGLFSLTPVWLLTVAGLAVWFGNRDDERLRQLAASVALVSLVCLTFYLSRPLLERSYGGKTCGLRWMFWFTPLWLVTMLPALDAMASRRWTRGLAMTLLVLSAMSVAYPIWNPWSQPWLYDLGMYLGWL